MLDALEDGELNFRFKDKSQYNRILNRIRKIFDRQRISNEQQSWTKLMRILTHELMNTLAPIISISANLTKQIASGDVDPKYICDGVDIIAESSLKMEKFIDNYRKVSGLSMPVKTDVDIIGLIDRIVELHREMLNEAQCKCVITSVQQPLVAHVDETQISQVLINILRNAIQANADIINIYAKNVPDSGITVRITNNGTPIHPDAQDKIFIPFYTTKTHGTGVGLSICRQIMEQHRGSIYLVRSNFNETVFEITFPS